MRNEKKKTCLDCLHCKVSAKSTKNLRLCFCAKGNKAEKHKEPFFLAKTVCREFENMEGLT